jgi:redox-regulated HSP33 family molecular chaperone
MCAKKIRKNNAQSISAGGSNYFEEVNIRNSQVAGRDLISVHTESTRQAFSTVYQAIAERQNTSPQEKDELKSLVKDAEEEIKQAEPNERLLTRVFKDIQKMAPDILEVALASLASPAAGLSLAAKKVLDKAAQSARPPATA